MAMDPAAVHRHITMMSVNNKALRTSLDSNAVERILAFAAMALLLAVLVAILRGLGEWSHVPFPIWLHLATILTALALTPVMLLRRRGDRLHRQLGWIWSVAMFSTAVLSFAVRVISPGHLSIIHILSVLTVVLVPVIVWSARTHRVDRHRRTVRGMIVGALLVAGFFTFPYGRLLGHWLFG